MVLGSWPKLTLGRWRDIPIRLEATFLLVPVFFLSRVSWQPTDQDWQLVAAGTLGVLLSILLHELGHAVTARLHQVGVREIVIGGFYGFATLKRQAIPRQSLVRILAAGPLANLLISIALLMTLSAAAPQGARLPDLTLPLGNSFGWQGETLRILALVNLAMSLFNLLPAFPLDGGRILAQLLGPILSPEANTRTVSGLSLLIGSVMILLGLGASLVLSLIGFMIVMINLRRFRRKPTSKRRSA